MRRGRRSTRRRPCETSQNRGRRFGRRGACAKRLRRRPGGRQAGKWRATPSVTGNSPLHSPVAGAGTQKRRGPGQNGPTPRVSPRNWLQFRAFRHRHCRWRPPERSFVGQKSARDGATSGWRRVQRDLPGPRDGWGDGNCGWVALKSGWPGRHCELPATKPDWRTGQPGFRAGKAGFRAIRPADRRAI
jgi:hypothetical protein